VTGDGENLREAVSHQAGANDPDARLLRHR
jgi:hypothetical protein